MDQYVFPSLPGLLDSINRKRAENGTSPIHKKDWSAFLSGVNGSPVRKAWIVALLKGEGIAKDKAWAILSSINAALKQAGLATVKASDLVLASQPSE